MPIRKFILPNNKIIYQVNFDSIPQIKNAKNLHILGLIKPSKKDCEEVFPANSCISLHPIKDQFEDFDKHTDAIYNAIDSALNATDNLIVFCKVGQSRSVGSVLWYIMNKYNTKLEDVKFEGVPIQWNQPIPEKLKILYGKTEKRIVKPVNKGI